MKKIAFLMTAVAVVLCLAGTAEAGFNWNAKFQLHYAGEHNDKVNTCALEVTDCTTGIVVDGPSGTGRYDIYVMALDADGIAGTRYGITCTGNYYFYGWTSCSDLELPGPGWPGCNTGNAQTWGTTEQVGNVTVGILDVYVYDGATSICTTEDPRVGFAEWCDLTSPEPICNKTSEVELPARDFYFSCVGFNGTPGVNRCGIIATEKVSWGAIKSLFR